MVLCVLWFVSIFVLMSGLRLMLVSVVMLVIGIWNVWNVLSGGMVSVFFCVLIRVDWLRMNLVVVRLFLFC